MSSGQLFADPLHYEAAISEVLEAQKAGSSSQIPRESELSREPTDAHKALVHILSRYAQPCMAIRQDGTVVAINGAGELMFQLGPGDNVSGADIIPLDGCSLTRNLQPLLDSTDADRTVFLRATYGEDLRPISFAAIGSTYGVEKAPLFLMFMIDITWNFELREHLVRTFKLTSSEQDVLERFVSGQKLQEIANHRGRSQMTVRTQFYAIMDKFCVSSQAELMQEVFKVSTFGIAARPMIETLRYPHRKQVALLRPGGRTVDIILSGDFRGRTVVWISTIGFSVRTREVEAELAKRGICLIILMVPGMGGTSQPLPNENFFETVSGDLEAVLEQLNVAQAPILTTFSSGRTAVNIARKLPNRISHVLLEEPFLPIKYAPNASSKSTIIQKAFAVGRVRRTSIRALSRMFGRTWVVLGWRKMSILVAGKYPDPDNMLEKPSIGEALSHGFEMTFSQGTDALVRDIELSLVDWEDEIRTCPIGITLLELKSSLLRPSSSLQSFVNSVGGPVKLVKIERSNAHHLRGYPNAYCTLIEGVLKGEIDGETVAAQLHFADIA